MTMVMRPFALRPHPTCRGRASAGHRAAHL